MHYQNCKWIQCAATDDVCYTGQMNFNGGYKNYVRGCADSSVLKSQCGNIGKVSILVFWQSYMINSETEQIQTIKLSTYSGVLVILRFLIAKISRITEL